MAKKKGYNGGGVVGTSGYSKQQYGKSLKADLSPKRRGYSDSKDGYEKREVAHKPSASISYSGKAYSKRKGHNDHGVDHKYKDGGIVGAAKKSALMDLKSKMSSMGGDSLFDNLDNDTPKNNYEDGGIVESNDENESEESGNKYDDLSREELLALLQNR